ncbi:MAG: DUF3795 domain-containing protein [Candidatus Bathyarchaeota archaeon]|nr:MAG: DUF3795 domain-containing protein [Candidatus Bathyarchaeota archaeon]
MDENLLGPCGASCLQCHFLNNEQKPSCSGCGAQNGSLFWGECKIFKCSGEREVIHCGVCDDFPCLVFVKQFDPEHGQKSVFTRAGLLAYRKKAGTKKYLEMIKKLGDETSES